MNTIPYTELLLSEAEVSALTDIADVHALCPDYFVVPKHWKLNKQSAVVYTEAGLEGLITVLREQKKEKEAYSLNVALTQLRATPSRLALAATGPIKTKPEWQNRADLA